MFFTPSSWGYTYSTPDMLIFAARGSDWVPSMNAYTDTTYLLGFALDQATASSKPAAVGSVPGYTLNQFSLDIFDGYLRVATTIESAMIPVVQEETGFVSVMPLRRETANQVIILDIPQMGATTTATGAADDEPGIFQEVNRIEGLGKPGEVFTAVRFFDNVGYAVTFERTDPFYSLNLNPQNPFVMGELNITGFSSYLHPINSAKTRLLAVGQEADDTGRILGAQLTLFDAMDPEDLRAVDRYTVEVDFETSSSTSVAWDYKAFRYVHLGPPDSNTGVAILPMRVNAWRNPEGHFDGFLVFDITDDVISYRFNVTHAKGEDFYGCYYPAYLSERSMVFGGDVTTMKGHSVQSTDLETGETEWSLKMPRPADKTDCVLW